MAKSWPTRVAVLAGAVLLKFSSGLHRLWVPLTLVTLENKKAGV
jgi:hypothetical protein